MHCEYKIAISVIIIDFDYFLKKLKKAIAIIRCHSGLLWEKKKYMTVLS
jgi:hypothetical protein